MKSVMYLKHKILEKSIESAGGKIKEIWEWPNPKTATEGRSVLAFTNYYQCFIYRYAQVTQPLYCPISRGNAF